MRCLPAEWQHVNIQTLDIRKETPDDFRLRVSEWLHDLFRTILGFYTQEKCEWRASIYWGLSDLTIIGTGEAISARRGALRLGFPIAEVWTHKTKQHCLHTRIKSNAIIPREPLFQPPPRTPLSPSTSSVAPTIALPNISLQQPSHNIIPWIPDPPPYQALRWLPDRRRRARRKRQRPRNRRRATYPVL